jgi:hypothetical protein
MSSYKARNVDKESGMSRVSSRKFAKRQPPPKFEPESESDSEISFSEEEPKKFLRIKQRDDTRRSKGTPPPKDKRRVNVRPNPEPIEEVASDVEEAKKDEKPVTSDFSNFLISAAYRTGFVKRAYPKESTYTPDVTAMFTCLYHMISVFTENSLLHEIFPAYTSIGLHAFYAHAFFFHVLRVRNEAQLLTRVERRCLRRYEQVGPLESWDIATPMIGYFQAFGRIVPEGDKYGQIVPELPNLSGLSGSTKNHLLQGLGTIAAVGKIPIMPAIHTFLRNYGVGTADYDGTDGKLYPIPNKILAAANPFLGLTASTATDVDFQALAFSAGWNSSHEHQIDTFMKIDAQKRMLVRRWSIPDIAGTPDLSNLENFLALGDTLSVTWIKELLRMSTAVNKFFPGSVNLANIPPITRVESVTHFTYKTTNDNRRQARDDVWYHGRSAWTATFEGKILRDDAALAMQSAFSTSVRSSFETTVIPTLIAVPFTGQVTGPYFTANEMPSSELDGIDQPDPVDQMVTLIESRLYDNKGGRA